MCACNGNMVQVETLRGLCHTLHDDSSLPVTSLSCINTGVDYSLYV